ncbi:MAG: TIGR02391 family protein [Gammaproteobacteria bacterium]|nr:TIGR02391 family protein [Gammaproteobacteria bacterium]
MKDRGLEDNSGESTKWRRLYWVFFASQQQYGCANRIIDFIQAFLIPARFVGRNEEFEAHRERLNTILAFSGLEYLPNGRFRRCEMAQTLDEAEERARTIQAKFQGRRLHSEMLKYCRAELMQDNYFHAVFEATKGLAQRIRDLSGIQADGAVLVDRVFSIDQPVLAINSLRTETEKTEHKGFAALLKGYSIQLGKMLQSRALTPRDQEISYLKARHVQWFTIRTSDAPRMWASPTEIKQFGISPGDLLVCEGGEGGRCGLVERLEGPFIIQNALEEGEAEESTEPDDAAEGVES